MKIIIREKISYETDKKEYGLMLPLFCECRNIYKITLSGSKTVKKEKKIKRNFFFNTSKKKKNLWKSEIWKSWKSWFSQKKIFFRKRKISKKSQWICRMQKLALQLFLLFERWLCLKSLTKFFCEDLRFPSHWIESIFSLSI